MSASNEFLNGRGLAIAMFGGSEDSARGEWTIYAIKKANRLFAKAGKETSIFVGRLSTVARVQAWLESHPDFVPNHYLRKPKSAAAEKPSKKNPAAASQSAHTRRPRLPAAA